MVGSAAFGAAEEAWVGAGAGAEEVHAEDKINSASKDAPTRAFAKRRTMVTSP